MPVRVLRPGILVESLGLLRLDGLLQTGLGGDVAELLTRVPDLRDDLEDGLVDLPGDGTENVEAGEDLVERVGVRGLSEVGDLLVGLLGAHDLGWRASKESKVRVRSSSPRLLRTTHSNAPGSFPSSN